MIETPSLVDQYCHGVLRTELGLGTFEAQLARTEGPPAPGTTFFDTQTGFAVRRWCPPLLGLEPHCPPARYLARRRELGVLESGRRLLRGSGITTYLVDTGLPGDLTGPEEMASAGDAEAHEIVRLELLAEQVADTSGTVESFLANLAESVHGAAASAVAFTSVAGVRHGLALAPEPPGPGEVRGRGGPLAGRTPGRRRAQRPRAAAAPAVDRGRLRACRSNSTRARRTGPAHRPYRPGPAHRLRPRDGGPRHRPRAAARLPVPPPRGPPRRCLPARVRRLWAPPSSAPGPGPPPSSPRSWSSPPSASSSSPAAPSGLPELHVVGARLFREALGRVLGGWVAEGAWSLADAQRVAGLIAAGNARRVYGLG